MRARWSASILLSVSTLTACGGGAPSTPPRDGGSDAARLDAAVVDAAIEDAAIEDDAAADDASIEDDAATEGDAASEIDAHAPELDAGPRVAPVIDGVLGGAEWTGAFVITNDVATEWAGNELTSVRGFVLDGVLYVAIQGRIEGGNAIVAYFEGDALTPRGVTDLTTLTDSTGALDNAISAGFASPVAVDLAWGTLDMSRTVSGPDDRMGFRDLVPSASDFAWITDATATTACSVSTCELAVPVEALGPVGTEIEMFVRIVNHDGTMAANQTLPVDDPSMPFRVRATYLVTE